MRVILFILLFTFVSANASYISQKFHKHINQQVNKIESQKAKLPPYKKKIDSYVLSKISKIQTAINKGKITDIKEIKQNYCDNILKINSVGALKLRILLKEDMSEADFEKYKEWLKIQSVTIIFAYYPQYFIKNSRPKISCYIPFDKIWTIAKDNRTASILPILKPYTKVGSYTTQGDEQLFARLAREQKNVDGTGIKIGVISDGIKGYTDSQYSGDLGMVSILQGHENLANTAGMEARAMMEIIYDIAPNCELMFGSYLYGDGTYEQMSQTVNDLISQGCKIIVDDVGFADEPWFTDSELAQDITNKINLDDIIYVSSAGNFAKSMYTGELNSNSLNANNWVIFYNDKSNDKLDTTNTVTVDTGYTTFVLQWADDWNHPDLDLDLYIINSNNEIVGEGGRTIQDPNGSNNPIEIVSYRNYLNTTENLNILVKYVKGDFANRKFKVLAINRDLKYTHDYGEEDKDQIFGHAAAEGAISVAAYPAEDTLHIEYFSSYGPTVLYEKTSGYSTRYTPTITATDGVNTSLVGTPFETFYGTSASAPHIAGIAALYRNYYKDQNKTHEDFYNALTQNADGIDGYSGGVWHKHSGYGKANAYETLGGGPLKIWVDELSTDSISVIGDKVFHWESQWNGYDTPYQFSWSLGSNQILKADTNIYQNEKFKYWVNDSSYIIKHSFTIDKNTNEIDAQFAKAYSASIKASLTSGGIGSVSFSDPWLRDTVETTYGLRNRGTEAIFHSYDSTLTLSLDSDHQGVFLDQNPDPNDPNKPYYSVKAKDQQSFTAHSETITGYFLKWEGTDVSFQSPDKQQTPVVFHQPNTEARAVYKGHLCSNVQNATATNNARKFAKTNDGKLHWVYVDDQKIWYAYSNDDGKTWSKEIRLDRDEDGSYYSAPSIAAFGDHVYIVYIENYDDQNFAVFERHINYDDATPAWSESDVVDAFSKDAGSASPTTSVTIIKRNDASGDFQPVIAVGYQYSSSKIDVYTYEDGLYMPTHEETGSNPSLSADAYHSINNEQIAMAFDHNGQVFITTAWWDNGVLTWGGEEQVSNDDDTYSDQSHPNVSIMNGYCHVVWSAYNTEDQKNEVLYRMYMPGSSGNTISSAAPPPGNVVPYGTVTEIKSSDYSVYNPSVTALEDQTAYIFYEKNGGIYRKHFVNQNYYGYSYFGTGHYPSVCDHVSQGAGWMHYDDAPFILRTDVNGPSNAIPIEPVNPNWGAINMKLSADANGGQEGHIIIRFYDFTYGQDTLQMNQALRTDSMNISGDNVPLTMNLEVIFKNVINRPADDDLIYTLNFVDNGDTINLTPLKYGDLPNNPSPNGERFFKLTTIVNLGSRGGKFAMKLADSSALVYRIIKTDESQSNPKVKLPSQVIPKTFALHQNFPNPFNPVTHITVDLPEDAKVHLSVYNVNGQKVKELMSGYKAAGTYEIIFDGKNLASGVYIYRLTTDKGFVQSKKMMLIR